MYILEKKNLQKTVNIDSLSPKDCFYISDAYKWEIKIYIILNTNEIIDVHNNQYRYAIELDSGNLCKFSNNVQVVKLTDVEITING
jgi:hypothetical protein